MGIANVKTPIPGPKSKALIDRWLAVEADSTGYQAPVVWDEGTVRPPRPRYTGFVGELEITRSRAPRSDSRFCRRRDTRRRTRQ